MISHYRKPILTLVVMGLLVWFLPSIPIDPWNLLNLKKIFSMVFALVLIQILGAFLNRLLGERTSAMTTGFLGGIVSSTATTATLARQSTIRMTQDNIRETLVFLSATLAMLVEGIVLIFVSSQIIHLTTLVIFLGPLIVTGLMIAYYSQKVSSEKNLSPIANFQIQPILKISLFIIAVLFLSKTLQNVFGQKGLMVLTFFVSLFEIHGSLIANFQLHENGLVSLTILNALLMISIVSSYFSKLFLIFILGSKSLGLHAFKCTTILLLSLILSWMITWGL